MALKSRLISVLVLALVCSSCMESGPEDASSEPRGLKRLIPSFMRSRTRSNEPALAQYSFVVEVNGRRRTEGQRVRHQISYQGIDCIETRTQQKTTRIRDGEAFTRTIDRQVITGPHGEALFSREIAYEGGQRTEFTIAVEQGIAHFESRDREGTTEQDVEVGPGVIFGINELWLAQQPLAPGKTFPAAVLSQRRRRVVQESATVLRLEEINFQGRPTEAWVIRTESEATPDNPVTIIMTRDGQLVRMEASGAVFRVVTEEEREAEPVERDTVVTSIPIEFPLIAHDRYDTIVLEAQPASAWKSLVMDSEYADVIDDGGITIAVKRYMPRVRPQEPFDPAADMPLGELTPDLLALTKPRGQVRPDERAIRQQARRIVKKENDALQAVAYLAGWVHHNIKWNARGRMNTGPVQTMKSMRGDCSEHADLFASLARAVGIPTRHCLGLKLERSRAIYHNWVEAWVGSAWVPVDTTINRVGLPATHVLTARESADTAELTDTLPWAMRQEKLGLAVQSIVKGDYRIDPANKRTFVATTGNWLANLYHGFAVTKPAPWNGRIGLRSVELTSPDGRPDTADAAGAFIYGTASFKIESMDILYRGSAGELAALVRSLKKQVQQFRELDADVVEAFNGKALFVDFTFVADGADMRYQQYIVPRRGRSYRIGMWAPSESFAGYEDDLQTILESVDL